MPKYWFICVLSSKNHAHNRYSSLAVFSTLIQAILVLLVGYYGCHDGMRPVLADPFQIIALGAPVTRYAGPPPLDAMHMNLVLKRIGGGSGRGHAVHRGGAYKKIGTIFATKYLFRLGLSPQSSVRRLVFNHIFS